MELNWNQDKRQEGEVAIYLERLTKKHQYFYQDATRLYKNAFPREERREEEEQKRILKKNEYHFDFLLEKEQLLGIVFYWETPDFIFLEHLAIRPELRNKHYGSQALSLLKEKGKKVILEIEPPVDELTRRRQGFYERNGFFLNDHFHIQPKYHRGDKNLELKIMSFPNVLSAEEYI